jgi:hypothetical protein
VVSGVRCGHTLANRAALAARQTLGRPAIAWTTFETVLVATQSHHTRHRVSAKRIRRDGSQLLAAD